MLKLLMALFLFVGTGIAKFECHDVNEALAAVCDHLDKCVQQADNNQSEDGHEEAHCSLRCSHSPAITVSSSPFDLKMLRQKSLFPYDFLYFSPPVESLKRPPIFA